MTTLSNMKAKEVFEISVNGNSMQYTIDNELKTFNPPLDIKLYPNFCAELTAEKIITDTNFIDSEATLVDAGNGKWMLIILL